MLRAHRGPSQITPRAVSLVFFSIGGQPLAARAEEVGGIWPWPVALSVPSQTPHVNGLVRQGESVLPVFDLAGKLGTRVRGDRPLCLIAKCDEGPMAVCIDESVPSIQVIEPEDLQACEGLEGTTTATCRVGTDHVPVYSLAKLTGQSGPSMSGGRGRESE